MGSMIKEANLGHELGIRGVYSANKLSCFLETIYSVPNFGWCGEHLNPKHGKIKIILSKNHF